MCSAQMLVVLLGQTSQPVESVTRSALPRDIWMLITGAAIALAESHRRMFEALGTIATLFPNTGQLNRLMDRIRPQIPPIRYPPDKVTSPAEIRAWADSYAARLYGIPESQYRRPIDDLVGYLRRHIDESD